MRSPPIDDMNYATLVGNISTSNICRCSNTRIDPQITGSACDTGAPVGTSEHDLRRSFQVCECGVPQTRVNEPTTRPAQVRAAVCGREDVIGEQVGDGSGGESGETARTGDVLLESRVGGGKECPREVCNETGVLDKDGREGGEVGGGCEDGGDTRPTASTATRSTTGTSASTTSTSTSTSTGTTTSSTTSGTRAVPKGKGQAGENRAEGGEEEFRQHNRKDGGMGVGLLAQLSSICTRQVLLPLAIQYG